MNKTIAAILLLLVGCHDWSPTAPTDDPKPTHAATTIVAASSCSYIKIPVYVRFQRAGDGWTIGATLYGLQPVQLQIPSGTYHGFAEVQPAIAVPYEQRTWNVSGDATIPTDGDTITVPCPANIRWQ